MYHPPYTFPALWLTQIPPLGEQLLPTATLTKCQSLRVPSKLASACLALVSASLSLLSSGCATVTAGGDSSNAHPVALAILTNALPSAQTQDKYSTSVAAAGGTAPYTWTVKSGTLPTGLSLEATGVISGTPTQAGNAAFAVQVNDSSSPQQTATQSLDLSVAGQPALAISSTTLPNGTAG